MSVKVVCVKHCIWIVSVSTPSGRTHYEKYSGADQAERRAKILAGTQGRITWENGTLDKCLIGV
jgi:hypothetical protein